MEKTALDNQSQDNQLKNNSSSEEKNKTNIYSANSFSKQRQIPLIYIIVLLLVIAVIGGETFYFLKLKNKKQQLSNFPLKQVEPTITKEQKLSNSKIVEAVLNWLDKQRDERGIYYLDRRCNTYPQTDCNQYDPSGTSWHIAIAPIWGRLKYYQTKKDSKDLQIVDKDLKLLTDREEIEFIQNDFWNCYLMYDLWQSQDLSQLQKDLVKEICWESAYYLPKDLESIRERKFIDNQYQDVIQAEIKAVKGKEASFESALQENDEAMVNEYSSYPADFLARYRWQKNETDLKKAYFYFNKAAQLLSQKRTLFNTDQLCVFGVSVVEMFNQSKDQAYLDWAKEIFTEVKANNQIKPVKCAFFADLLYKSGNEEKYLQEKKDILTKLIENSYDYKEDNEFKGYLVGDGCFRSLDENGDAGLVKSIRENGLLVGILSGL